MNVLARVRGLSIRRFAPGDDEAINRFNARLKEGGSPLCMYSEPKSALRTSTDLPNEQLLVVTEGDEIRGGVFLRQAPFQFGTQVKSVGWIKWPISESLVDKSYAGRVTECILSGLQAVQPNLMMVGLGGHHAPFAKFLAKHGWSGSIVPTFVLPLHAHQIATELPHLRRRQGFRLAASFTRWSGLGRLGNLLLPTIASVRARTLAGTTTASVSADLVENANSIWESVRLRYDALAIRDASWMQWSYPEEAPAVVRLSIMRGDRVIGWAIVQHHDRRKSTDHESYGRLRLGVIHDALCLPEDAESAFAATVLHLIEMGSDLIVTNQLHPSWQSAARRMGFLEAPPSFAFYRSPAIMHLFNDLKVEQALLVNAADHGLLSF